MRPSTRSRGGARAHLLAPVAAVCLTASLLLSACSPAAETPVTAYNHPAATMIVDLLEMRRADVRDPEAYAPYFLESALATALATGSTQPTGTPCVPEWEGPYVSAETTATAEVVVIWEASDDFPDWPPVTIFSSTLEGDRWVLTDAFETTVAPAPIASVRER